MARGRWCHPNGNHGSLAVTATEGNVGRAAIPGALQGNSVTVTAICGTFNTATVTLQTLAGDGATWVKVIEFAAAEHKSFELAEGQIRAAVTGGPPSGIYAVAVQF